MSTLSQFGFGRGSGVGGYVLSNPIYPGLPDPASVVFDANPVYQPNTISTKGYQKIEFNTLWSHQPQLSTSSAGMGLYGNDLIEITNFNARPFGGSPISVYLGSQSLKTINGMYVDLSPNIINSFTLVCPQLTTVTGCTFFYLLSGNTNFSFSQSQLNSTSVDEILVSLSNGRTGGSGQNTANIDIAGSCAAPGTAGAAAANTLRGYGFVVYTN